MLRCMAAVLVLAQLALPAAAEPLRLKIGVLSGLSGVAAKWGKYQNHGIDLAVEEANRNGAEIKLVYEDSQTLSAKAIGGFRKLHKADKVDAVIGTDFGFTLAPLIPIAAREKKLLVATSLGLPDYCEQGRGYFYTATSQFSISKPAFEKFIRLHPHLKKVSFFVFDDPEWGNSYLKIWKELAAQYNLRITELFLTSEFAPDYKPGLARAIAGGTEAIFLAHEPVSFLKALRSYDYKGLMISANNIYEVLVEPGPHPELEGVFFVDPEISREFSDKFQARFKEPPILEAYAGYESVRSVIKAFENNRANPADGFKSVKYQGVAGPFDYSTSCAGNFSQWGLYRFRNGRAEPVA